MVRNPLNYSNRTYLTIKSELDALYPNKPDWYKVILAGLFDNAHWYMDARAQNVLMVSAFTQSVINAIALMLDYRPSTRSASSGAVALTLDTPGPYTISKADLLFTIVSPQNDTLHFEALADVVVPSLATSVNVTISHLTRRNSIPIGSTDGSTHWQEVLINDTNILQNPSPVAVISAQTYTAVDTLVNSLATDKVFRTLIKPNGVVALMFGDGTYGVVPPLAPVLSTYYVGGGQIGNILAAGSSITYIGADTRISSVAFVDARFSGGSDGELMETTRDNAPKFLRTAYRAVNEQDDVVLALRYDASIIQAKSFPGLYGEGTVALHIIPAGGGNPSTLLKTNLQAYMIQRSPPSKADTRVRNPSYAPQNISMGIKMRQNYNFSDYGPYAEVALKLIVSEKTFELVAIYRQSGILAAITYLNTVWGYSFGTSDTFVIDGIIQNRIRDGLNSWGALINPNDMITSVDILPGVFTEELTTPLPTSSPVQLAFYEVATEGTITVTAL